MVVALVVVLASSLMTISIYPSLFNDGPALNEPDAFSLLLPGNDSTDIGPWPLLEWEDSDGAATFSLWISTTVNAFSQDDKMVNNATWATSYEVEASLEADTLYHWRVAAINDDGVTICSEDHSFRTGQVPASFTLLQPTDNSYNLDQYLGFN